MTDLIFKILCRVLYSYLYDDETLSIPYDEVIELEKTLVELYKSDAAHYKSFLLLDSELHPLIFRFEYFKENK